jgi:hypothetical protein
MVRRTLAGRFATEPMTAPAQAADRGPSGPCRRGRNRASQNVSCTYRAGPSPTAGCGTTVGCAQSTLPAGITHSQGWPVTLAMWSKSES